MSTSQQKNPSARRRWTQRQQKALSSLVVKVIVSAISMPGMLCLSGCGDGFNTQLRQRSEQLHAGMSLTEVTNFFAGFEVLGFTNYPTPIESSSWHPRSERDYITKGFSTNSTAGWILFRTPGSGWGWRDTCRVDFDEDGALICYTWMYPH